MIDLSNEELIALRDLPKHLPPRPNGKRIHISAIYRWIQRGVRGVRLESVRIGGTTYTSEEALQRFAEQSSAGQEAMPALPQLTSTRRKQIDQAEKEVRQILGLDSVRRRQVKDETCLNPQSKGLP